MIMREKAGRLFDTALNIHKLLCDSVFKDSILHIFALLFFGIFLQVKAEHAITLFGTPKYPKNFSHFEYANPDAPKGGIFKNYALGDFNSLNPFLQKGNPAAGTNELIYDTLGVSSLDESASEYALLAKEFIKDKNGFFLDCILNENAYFSDGIQVSASDVKFSFDTLIALGKFEYQRYYADIQSVEVLNPRHVRFHFKTNQNSELPLIISQLPVLPQHVFMKDGKNTFGEDPLLLPVGSGPYIIESYEIGRTIVYKRNPNYWAKDHPTRKGFFNFEMIVFEYYKEPVVAQQAFMSGAYDWRVESSAKTWAKDYNTNRQESLRKIIIPNKLPSTLQGFFFNTKNPFFANKLVREAIFYAFDFEWSNTNLFFGQYERTINIFDNSRFASKGIADGKEREILLKLPLADNRILDSLYMIPRTDLKLPPNIPEGYVDWRGVEHKEGMRVVAQEHRENLKYAASLLKQAGFVFKNGVLMDSVSHKPLEFEILINYDGFERICLPFIENLKTLGIRARVLKVDDTQYLNRLRDYKYDMVIQLVGQSLNPGNEQRFYWGSEASKNPGGRNYAAIEDENVDFLIQGLIEAKDDEEKVAFGKALDRVLLWGFYVIPHFHAKGYRVAFWNDRITMPQIQPIYGFDPNLWWASNLTQTQK